MRLKPRKGSPPYWRSRHTHTHTTLIARRYQHLRIRGQSQLPLRYSIRWHNLSESSVSGALTLVVRNAIAKHVSGLALLVTYRVFTTIVWNSADAASNNLSQSSFTTNKLSGADVLNRCFVTGMNPSPCFSAAASYASQIPSK